MVHTRGESCFLRVWRPGSESYETSCGQGSALNADVTETLAAVNVWHEGEHRLMVSEDHHTWRDAGVVPHNDVVSVRIVANNVWVLGANHLSVLDGRLWRELPLPCALDASRDRIFPVGIDGRTAALTSGSVIYLARSGQRWARRPVEATAVHVVTGDFLAATRYGRPWMGRFAGPLVEWIAEAQGVGTPVSLGTDATGFQLVIFPPDPFLTGGPIRTLWRAGQPSETFVLHVPTDLRRFAIWGSRGFVAVTNQRDVVVCGWPS